VFGVERAIHIYLDIVHSIYKIVKNIIDVSLIISYNKSPKNPDLTWLDSDDPGFLEIRKEEIQDRAVSSAILAADAGAKKIILLSTLSPAIKKEWIEQAFNMISDKNIVLGPTKEGGCYLLGFSPAGIRILENLDMNRQEMIDEISEKSKRLKLSVQTLPETYVVWDEESLREWVDSREQKIPFAEKTHIEKVHRKKLNHNHHETVQ
ncbi:MAG: DUF2064 domain-containing protein, partial [Elusimicrobiota bacterium]